MTEWDLEPDWADENYESIDEIAADNGFYIDDDGHWQPIEEMPGYEEWHDDRDFDDE